MGVIDSIAFTQAGETITIQRPVGPLEEGLFTPAGSGTWVPDLGPEQLRVVGFGAPAAGGAYYDTSSVTSGDAAQLWIDPTGPSVWLQT